MNLKKIFALPYIWFLLVINVINGQVIVDFDASIREGCGSFQVNFTDLSYSINGTIVSRKWDLGGITATSQNPGRFFNTPGKYTICLTAEDDMGNIASNAGQIIFVFMSYRFQIFVQM